MTIDPRTLSPRDAYNLLVSAVVPRPIALVTSMNEGGGINAAPYSFFNVLTGTPPLLMISIGRNNGEMKNTAANILRRKEFVIHLVDDTLVDAMNIVSAVFPPGVSKIERARIALVPSSVVRTPRIGSAPVSCECVLHRHIEIGTDPSDLIIGEVVHFHIAERLSTDGTIDQTKFKPVARMGKNFYARINELFTVEQQSYGDE
jgi:flavin reductase (DIM6/NTAB) family NADH-FMN oxidoreductase RutF